MTVLFFLTLLAGSGLISLDPWRSLLGSYDRSMGLSAWLAAGIILCAAVPLQIWHRSLMLTVAILSLIAIAQNLGWLPMPYLAVGENNAGYFDGRSFATLGNPNLLANWLVLAIPLIAYVASRTRRNVLFAIAILGLVSTVSRGAMIALMLASCWVYRHQVGVFWRQWRARAAWYLPIAVALFLASMLVLATVALPLDSLYARFDLWQHSIQALSGSQALCDAWQRCDGFFNFRLWLGFGADMQAAVLDRVHMPNAGISQDRAHQFVLDLWLQFGLVGVLFALYLGWQLRQLVRSTNKPEQVALLAALLSWQISFASIATLTLFALIAGHMWQSACALKTKGESEVPDNVTHGDGTLAKAQTGQLHDSQTAKKHFFGLLSRALLTILAFFSFAPARFLPFELPSWRKPEWAVLYYQRAQQTEACGNQIISYWLSQAVSHDPWRVDMALALTRVKQAQIACPPHALVETSHPARICQVIQN